MIYQIISNYSPYFIKETTIKIYKLSIVVVSYPNIVRFNYTIIEKSNNFNSIATHFILFITINQQ